MKARGRPSQEPAITPNGADSSLWDSRPRPIGPDGSLVDRATFAAWLSKAEGVGNLRALLSPILPESTGNDPGRLADLTDAVLEACYGAYVFNSADWRAKLRESDDKVREAAPRLRAALSDVHETLSVHSVRLTLVTEYLERSLRGRFDDEFRFPPPAEDFVLDFLELLARNLDPTRPSGAHHPRHVTCHGCLDYMRPVQGLKSRDRRQMLAFNLELLLRSASLGSLIRVGAMPKGGRPHRPVVAALVGATIPEGKADTQLTEGWVSSAVKGIQKANPLVQVVPWPTGTDEVGFTTWYAPGESFE